MNLPNLSRYLTGSGTRLFALYLIIVAAAMIPIWSVNYFVSQDGVPHVYNAYLIYQLINGNESLSAYLTLNSFTVPNSTGHWLLVILLRFLSPFVALKVIATLTFAVFAGSVVWLRVRSQPHNKCSVLVVLLACAMAFNWMWFSGFYNFIIGAAAFTFCIASFYSWYERPNFPRWLGMSILLTLAYMSHIVPFVMAAASLLVFSAISSAGRRRVRNVLFMLTACLPALSLALWYRVSVGISESVFPAWRTIGDGSVLTILNHLRSVDPFVLISRMTLPFSTNRSAFYGLLAPSLWLAVVLAILVWPSIRDAIKVRFADRLSTAFLVLLTGWIVFSIVGPDDFGITNGGILRDRVMLCGLIFAIPLIRAPQTKGARILIAAMLLAVVIFQTAALWDYSITESRVAAEVRAALPYIADSDSIMTITVVADGMRFHSVPEPNLGAILGFEKTTRIWDDYELGYTLFPILARYPADRQFYYQVSISHAFKPADPKEHFDETLARLKTLLGSNDRRFTKIVFLGTDQRVDSLLANWFDPQPIFADGDIRVLKHRD